jgi:26S proteasome regulatory subunit T6
MSLQRGINLRALAEKMGQCSGAEVRGICTEAGSFLPYHPVIILTWPVGMYALRERRQHVTQEDFEFAVAKVRIGFCWHCNVLTFVHTGTEEEPRRKYLSQ